MDTETIVKISSNNANGQALLNAVQQMRQAYSTFRHYHGLMLKAIAAGPDEAARVFGVESPTQAAIFAERWTALLLAANGQIPEQFQDEPYAILTVLIDGTTYQ